jgi:hypothetical protein
MARLLIVHHTSSPSMQAMLEAVESITGLRWHRARPPVTVVGGGVGPKHPEACWEPGATVAAELVS